MGLDSYLMTNLSNSPKGKNEPRIIQVGTTQIHSVVYRYCTAISKSYQKTCFFNLGSLFDIFACYTIV